MRKLSWCAGAMLIGVLLVGGGYRALRSTALVAEAHADPNCTPDTSFCDGDNIIVCSHSGAHAVLSQACAGVVGSSTNPGTCSSTCGTQGNGVCCVQKKPAVEWSFTSPAFSGSAVYGTSTQNTGSLTTDACSNIMFSVNAPQSDQCNPTGPGTVYGYIVTAGLTPGQVLTLPNEAVELLYGEYVAGESQEEICETWSGTVTYVSAVPSPKLTIDATCMETDVPFNGINVVGSISGNL